MRTSSAFATISYNTDKFLIHALNNLISDKKIEFFAFINHLPEEDETKKHKHLLIIPNGLIDTSIVYNALIEPDDDKSKPPLGIIRCVHSKFSDWYLYGLHDKDYLASKVELRKYHYEKSDFIVSDTDYFNELVHTSDFSKFKAFSKFRDSVNSGMSFRDLFSCGFIPVQQIKQYEHAFYLLRNEDDPNTTYRSYHSGHELVNTETGEIFDERNLKPLQTKQDRVVDKQLTLID